MDPAVREGGDNGLPVVIAKAETPVARALREISENVAARISVAAVQQNNFIPINVIG
jgi:ATP-binding protein involved in chromosome partitioning